MNTRSKMLEILLELHHKSRSGILRGQRDTKKKQLVLNNGLLAFAESNVPEEHLAHIMVAMDLIPRASLNDIVTFMKEGKTSEEALLSLPEADPRNIEMGRREQAIQITASLLGWEGGDFRLHRGDNFAPPPSNLNMPMLELATLAVRRAVSKRILSMPSGFLSGTLEVMDTRGREFPLNSAELQAHSALKSERPAAELLPLIPEGSLKPEHTLLALYHLGLIEYHEKKDAADEASASNPLVLRLNELQTQFESANLYEVLAVSADATQNQIQAAYHEQAKQLHPDRFQTNEFSPRIRAAAERVFAKINEAYHTLKNVNSRKLYDLELPKKKPAVTQQKAAATQNAETAEGLFREGRSLLAKGDVDTAVERLRGSVWLCPEKASYNYYLGLAEARIPKFRKSAERHFLKAIELEDTSVDSHLALARLYIDVRLPRKAELQLDKVLLWEPNHAEAQMLSAELKKLR